MSNSVVISNVQALNAEDLYFLVKMIERSYTMGQYMNIVLHTFCNTF